MRPENIRLASLAPPIATMAVVSITISISVPLFSLLMERAGATGTEIGINHTISALAMVIGAPLLPRIIARIGLLRLIMWSLFTVAICMLAIPVFTSLWWWGLLRVGWGFAGTALFFASEYWLVSITPDAVRGRVVGVYVVILSGSYMMGPLILRFLGIDSWLTYALPTVLVALAAVPVLLGRRGAPDARADEAPTPMSLLRFFRTDPAIVWGCVLFGVVEIGAMGLITVWALRSGYPQESAVELAFWLAFGSMAFQFPVGWAADRFDRRKLLCLAGAVSLVMPLVIIAFAQSYWIVSISMAIWGGMAVACYSLALTELGHRYEGPKLAEGNAAVVLAYGLGALLAPTALGTAMDLAPPHGTLWLAAAAGGAYFLLVAIRLSLIPRNSLDSERQNSR